jgi:hypothetical protein
MLMLNNHAHHIHSILIGIARTTGVSKKSQRTSLVVESLLLRSILSWEVSSTVGDHVRSPGTVRFVLSACYCHCHCYCRSLLLHFNTFCHVFWSSVLSGGRSVSPGSNKKSSQESNQMSSIILWRVRYRAESGSSK